MENKRERHPELKKTSGFILWELLALFFLLSYTTVIALIGEATTIDTLVGILIQWLWIMMMILCILLGIISLK